MLEPYRLLEHEGEGYTKGKNGGFFDTNSTAKSVDGRNVGRIVLIRIEIGLAATFDKARTVYVAAYTRVADEVLRVMSDAQIAT